ncbi:MAG: sigma-70 family RNA polymerase sigma factor [candidate division Zixibacteria bacterium]|nr:sigma-70 family RNA polymerase sigma factor [candidate division Zixibacteria bacterium]
MDEKELVKRAQSGDFDAFSRLITEQKDKIYRLALKLTGNREDAEDIVQETFLKAVDNIDKFRLESSFGTWLYTIALNNVRAHMGSRKKMTLKPIEEYLPSGHSDENTHTQLFDWGDPHQLFEQKQLDQIIESALAALPQKYSMPFMLRYMEDLSVKDIARILKLSLPAAKSRILRARLALREQLAEHFREKIDEKV